MFTIAKQKLNSIHAKLDWQLRRNEKVLQEAVQKWFAFTIKQIQTDMRTKFQKDIVAELTDWEYLQQQGQEILKPATLSIMQSGGNESYKMFQVKGAFDVLNVESVKVAEKFTAGLVREVNNETKKGLRTYIKAGVKEGKSMDKISREIRPLVGLTQNQTQSVMNYKTLLSDKEKYPKLSAADIERKTSKYASKTHRRRTQTIARTETARAQNLGYAQGMEDLGVEQLEFSATIDEHTSDTCMALDGKKYKVGEASNIIPVHPNSFAKDTDIYTDNGFVNVSKIKVGDKCLSLNTKTLSLEYVNVVDKVKHKQDKMIHFHSHNFDLLVTPEHEMFTKKSWEKRKSWSFVQAKNITEYMQFYRSSEWIGNKNKNIKICENTYKSGVFAEFMGWWLSEGSLSRGKIQVAQSKSKNRDKYDRIVEIARLLSTNGRIWCSKYGVIFKNDNLHQYLKQFGHAHKKHVPKEIKQLSKEYIRIFLDAYIAGDGHKRKPGQYKNYNFRPDITYATSSRRMADGLGELLIKVGRRPSYSLQKVKGVKVKFKTGVYAANHNVWIVRECYAQMSLCHNNTGIKIKTVDYKSMVYCVELQKYHTLLVRRNGKVAWCGNCRCAMLPVVGDRSVCRGIGKSMEKAACVPPDGLHDAQIGDLVNRWESAKSAGNKWNIAQKLKKLGYDVKTGKPPVVTVPRVKPAVITPKPKPKLEIKPIKKPSAIEQKLRTDRIKSDSHLGGGANETRRVTNDFHAVFKPKVGEGYSRDFVKQGTYYKREAAAYQVDQLLGLNITPPTVIREVGGKIGSMQQWVKKAKVLEQKSAATRSVGAEKIGFFDIVIGNTDRHTGNAMYQKAAKKRAHKMWAIDNGLSFENFSIMAEKAKSYGLTTMRHRIRTYTSKEIAGKKIPAELSSRLKTFVSNEKTVRKQLNLLLDRAEIDGMFMRAKWLLKQKKFPETGRTYKIGEYKNLKVLFSYVSW